MIRCVRGECVCVNREVGRCMCGGCVCVWTGRWADVCVVDVCVDREVAV